VEVGGRVDGRQRGFERGSRFVAIVVFAVSFLLVAALLTLRTTALNAGWYRAAIEDSHTYDRLYNKVLTDPAVTRETRDLLAGRADDPRTDQRTECSRDPRRPRARSAPRRSRRWLWWPRSRRWGWHLPSRGAPIPAPRRPRP